MKQEVFEGYVDGKKFDDPVKFKEYLEEHKDAKNVSYSHSIREVADKELKRAIPTNAVVEHQDKEQYVLYPPYFDLDELLSQKIDFEEYEKGYEEYLKGHEQVIKDINDDVLEEHRENLQQLRIQTKEKYKQNDRAINSLDSEIKQFEEQIEKYKREIRERQSKRNVLEKADQLIGIRYRALKQAIAMVNQRLEVLQTKTKSKSAFENLLTTLGTFGIF